MELTDLPCAVLIYDEKAKAIRQCGQKSTYTLRFNNDLLFATCSRHDGRLKRAFPRVSWN